MPMIQEPERNLLLTNRRRMCPREERRRIWKFVFVLETYVCALLDTGCEHSVIGRRLIPNAILEPTRERLYTANEAELPLLGEIELQFRVGDASTSVKAVVTDALTDLILGIDRLRDNQCIWDFGKGTFEMRGNVGTLYSKQSRASVRRLFVDEETVVPAKHQAHVPVTTTFTSLTGAGIWAVEAKAINRDTVVASSLHDKPSVKTVVRIINLSDKPRKFRRGELVTESELVELCENTEETASLETADNSLDAELSDPLNESDIPVDFSLEKHQQELFEINTTANDLSHLDSM